MSLTKPGKIAASIAVWIGAVSTGSCLVGGGVAFAAPALENEVALHDPLKSLEEQVDEPGRAILDGILTYDAAGILAAIGQIEERQGTDDAKETDRYVLAQGYLELLVIRRFYERELEDQMPAPLRERSPDKLADLGIEFAAGFEQDHPDHSDILRVRGELISFKIRGMTSGFTEGPKAKEAIEKALEIDPGNAWARFGIARMLFHNPAIAGGDKEQALVEFRAVAKPLKRVRVRLYLALSYDVKGMPQQARYWLLKAKQAAPKNPEVLERTRRLQETLQGDE